MYQTVFTKFKWKMCVEKKIYQKMRFWWPFEKKNHVFPFFFSLFCGSRENICLTVTTGGFRELLFLIFNSCKHKNVIRLFPVTSWMDKFNRNWEH